MIVVIAGQTATGKTETAVKLAKIIDAEIISADSVAVYKHLNIGSAKPSLEEREGIVHHLIDVYELDETYNVAVFQKEARRLIQEIEARNKHVIVVGGTGLYIKALLYDYRFENETIEVKERTESNESLYQELLLKDLETAKSIHPNNRKRVLRALDSYDYHGKTRQELNKEGKDTQIIDAHVFYLMGNKEKIDERINQRVAHMFEKGLEAEVESLYKLNPQLFEYNSTHSIGYKEFKNYFDGNIDKEGLVFEIQRNTRRFAKRQMTWFKHQLPSIWIDIFEEDPLNSIVKKTPYPVQFE